MVEAMWNSAPERVAARHRPLPGLRALGKEHGLRFRLKMLGRTSQAKERVDLRDELCGVQARFAWLAKRRCHMAVSSGDGFSLISITTH